MKKQNIRKKAIGSMALSIAFAWQPTPTLATVPRDPERLLEVETCDEAKRNLIEARKGSPLVSKAKNAKIVHELEEAVKRLCTKQ